MNYITVHDKTFETFISESEINRKVGEIGQAITSDYKGKTPILIGMLNGAFIFCSDLLRSIEIPCEVTFVRFSSYKGTKSTGKVNEILTLQENIEGRDIIIVEDIIDSGLTMQHTLNYFGSLKPNSIAIASLLLKPDCLKCEVNVKYLGFEIPEKFVVGYGLDYAGLGRSFKDIYQLKAN